MTRAGRLGAMLSGMETDISVPGSEEGAGGDCGCSDDCCDDVGPDETSNVYAAERRLTHYSGRSQQIFRPDLRLPERYIGQYAGALVCRRFHFGHRAQSCTKTLRAGHL